jgi:serine/threonine protein kinase
VAIKVIRLVNFDSSVAAPLLERFEREAKSLAKMMHPNIVPVYDFGEHNDSPYLVMAYIPGGTLKTLAGKAMPYQQAGGLLVPVAQSLSYAHGLNIIHCDVKPANILITVSGQPMLSGFGIAKIMGDSRDTLTATGAYIGTPEYMPPEQWTNHVVPQTDIYSLGVVFYELVTGRRPFAANIPAGVLLKHFNEPVPPPTRFVPGLPVEVEQVLFKALAKRPAERYASMADFAAVLEKLSLGSLASETVRVDIPKGNRVVQD